MNLIGGLPPTYILIVRLKELLNIALAAIKACSS
jgi:hypothetical protein